MTIGLDLFVSQLEQGQQKLAQLMTQVDGPRPFNTLFQESLDELSNAFEEIHVLVEELTLQCSQLQTTQKTLEVRQQQHYELFNLAPDGYIITDQKGLIQQINVMASQLLNRPQGRFIGKPLATVIAKQSYQQLYRLLSELYQGQAQQNVYLSLKPNKGKPFQASFTITVIYDHQDKVVGFRWLFRDLTPQQLAATALKTSEQRYATLTATVPVGIFRTDAEGHFIYVNQRWCQISGLTPEAVLQDRWFQGIHPDDRERVTAEWAQSVPKNRSFKLEFRFQHPHGQVKWVYAQISPEKNGKHDLIGYVGSITDITELKQTQDLLKHNSLHDPLTHLPNRTLMLERLELTLNKANRNSHYDYAVLFLDLDRFKVINDSLGHAAGDQLLIALSQRLKTYLRTIDLVARFGGDEFVILLEGIDNPAAVVQIVDRILADCQTPYIISGHEIFPSFSVGIVLGSPEYHCASDLIRDADIAMYRAKTEAHSSYIFFDEAMHAQSLQRLTLETDLRKALEDKNFSLYYQPIIELDNQRLVGFEALVRWHHPADGITLPNDFIPMAEEIGLIVPLDRWVFHTACQQLAAWRRQYASSLSLKMNINLSAKDLGKPDFVEVVDQSLAETGLKGDDIILEITESILIADIEQTIYTLTQLTLRGIQISIDDFGTGYSSLRYLQRLPINSLKIDRSFVRQMQTDNQNHQLIGTILALGNQLDLTVVAEGIETMEQLRSLQQLGCQLGQGYFFSPPRPAADIESTFLQNPDQGLVKN